MMTRTRTRTATKSVKRECVLDVVHVPMVCPLDDLLGVIHHVSQENQEAKVELQRNKILEYIH